MSLLVTSCTMGKQPDRLLNKGPEYLRTRTNRGMFAHHRKSAVELLAASKAQFYKVPSASAHDRRELIQRSHRDDNGHGQRSQDQLSRSKSEFDVSTLRALIADEDERNELEEDVNIRLSVSSSADEDGLNFEEQNRRNSSYCAASNSDRDREVLRRISVGDSVFIDQSPCSVTSNPLTQHRSMPDWKSRRREHKLKPVLTLKKSSDSCNIDTSVSVTSPVSKPPVPGSKPTPLPRKQQGGSKPVPPPRKANYPPVPPRPSSTSTASHGSEFKGHNNVLPTSNPASPNAVVEDVVDGVFSCQEGETSVISNLATPQRKRSLVETLAQHFTSLCTDFQFSSSSSNPHSPSTAKTPPPPPAREEEEPVYANTSVKGAIEYSQREASSPRPDTLYKAKPVCIPRVDESPALHFTAKPVFIYPQTNSVCQNPSTPPAEGGNRLSSPTCQSPPDSNNNLNKGRKRYPELPMSNKHSSKRERKTCDVAEIIPTSPAVISQCNAHPPFLQEFGSDHNNKGRALENMSIESVERMVYDSEVNASPAAVTTSVDSLEGGDGEPRQVTRVNSSLSGKMEAQDAAAKHCPHSPTRPTASVPRSHSDISCRLEGQHSRDSSRVSTSSRFSRASVGADLEKFFNQMGLEMGILEPVSQLRELQNSEILASVSSLDSHDASSIGSTFSGSENDISEAQSLERSQQPTSVVERNARIIKWLCNVRKAKTQSLNLDSAAAKSSTASSATGNA